MSAWYDGRMVSFDVESTSVDVETARIVQAHMAYVGGGKDTRTADVLIDPGVEIPDEAAAVHGITTERARIEGVPAPGAIAQLAFALRQVIAVGVPLVAYNVPYDVTVMDRECRRHMIDPPDWSRALFVDPLVIWKWADRFRRGSRNLAAACECFGVELTDAHDAGADALAAVRVAWRMMHKTDLVQGRHPEIIQRRAFWKSIRENLPELQRVQASWYAEQASSLRLYFEGRGEHEKAATVREDWPLVPYVERVEA